MLGTRRSLQLVAAAAVAALVLTGCGGDDSEGANPAPTGPTEDTGCGFESGPFSDAVSVEGDFGGEVEPTYDRPLKPTSLQRSIVSAGKGKEAADGRLVSATVSVFNAKTGDLINRQTNKTTVGDAATPEVLAAGLRCVPLGSRVVATAPASALFGPGGNPDAGLAPNDGVVVVTDVAAVVAPKAVDWPEAPAVSFAGRKSPKVSVPTGAAPDQLLVDVIRPGTGALVRSGDLISVNFKTMLWGSGKVVQETYGKGKAPLRYGTNDFIPGFTAAVVGQRAGAQLVVTVPPEFAYGPDGAENVGIKGTDTLLIVIEIESTQTPPEQPAS